MASVKMCDMCQDSLQTFLLIEQFGVCR